MQDIIGKVLHRLIDLDLAILKRIETTMEAVLSEYEIQEKGMELMPINADWQTELQIFLDRKRICGKSEKTLEQYQYNLSRALGYINKAVKDITTADLADYLEKYKRVRRVSNVYLQNIRLNLSSFFGWLHDKGMIPRNPARGLDSIKVEKRIKKPYSDEELEKIKRECKTVRDLALVEFLFSTGVRVSELCALDRTDVHLHDSTEIIVYGKGAKERKVYLTPVSAMYLSAYLYQRTDDDPALFVSQKAPHTRLSTHGVREILAGIGKRCGISKVHPHRFRRTVATSLLSKGAPLQIVQHFLGHCKPETTMVYCTVDDETVKADHRKYLCA